MKYHKANSWNNVLHIKKVFSSVLTLNVLLLNGNDPEDIINNNIKYLVEDIDVKNTTLWEKLVELKLYKSSDVDQTLK